MFAFVNKKRALAEIERRRGDESTYTTPLDQDAMGSDDMKEFLMDFYKHIIYRQEVLKEEMEKYPNTVKKFQERLVVGSNQMTREDFWQRYYYRTDSLERVIKELEVSDAKIRQQRSEAIATAFSNAQKSAQTAFSNAQKSVAQTYEQVQQQQQQQQEATNINKGTVMSSSTNNKTNNEDSSREADTKSPPKPENPPPPENNNSPPQLVPEKEAIEMELPKKATTSDKSDQQTPPPPPAASAAVTAAPQPQAQPLVVKTETTPDTTTPAASTTTSSNSFWKNPFGGYDTLEKQEQEQSEVEVEAEEEGDLLKKKGDDDTITKNILNELNESLAEAFPKMEVESSTTATATKTSDKEVTTPDTSTSKSFWKNPFGGNNETLEKQQQQQEQKSTTTTTTNKDEDIKKDVDTTTKNLLAELDNALSFEEEKSAPATTKEGGEKGEVVNESFSWNPFGGKKTTEEVATTTKEQEEAPAKEPTTTTKATKKAASSANERESAPSSSTGKETTKEKEETTTETRRPWWKVFTKGAEETTKISKGLTPEEEKEKALAAAAAEAARKQQEEKAKAEKLKRKQYEDQVARTHRNIFILLMWLITTVLLTAQEPPEWMVFIGNGLCAPVVPFLTTLTSNVDAQQGGDVVVVEGIAPWWAPPQYKEYLFDKVCGKDRHQTQLTWTAAKKSKKDGFSLSITTTTTTSSTEGKKNVLLSMKRIQSVQIFPSYLQLLPVKATESQSVNALWAKKEWTLSSKQESQESKPNRNSKKSR